MIKELTDASNTSVVVLAKLDSELNHNPDSNCDEAGSSNVGHDLQKYHKFQSALPLQFNLSKD